MTRLPVALAFLLLAVGVAACAPVASSATSRELAAVETERVCA